MGDEEDSMDVATPGSAQAELSSLDEKILTCPINTEMVLSDLGYRKHLIKHSNKYVYGFTIELIKCKMNKKSKNN